MPYKSLKQMRFLHAKHPEIARRWDREYGTRPLQVMAKTLTRKKHQ